MAEVLVSEAAMSTQDPDRDSIPLHMEATVKITFTIFTVDIINTECEQDASIRSKYCIM